METRPMRTGSRAAVVAGSLTARLLLADELEQLAIRAAAALLGDERGILARIAHQGEPALGGDADVLARESRRRPVVGDQFGAPAFGLVQGERVLRAPELALVD